jgi:hypothetical protein
VERVTQTAVELPQTNRDTRLHFLGGDNWQLRQGEGVLADYAWEDLRYSISWKGYCFKDSDEEALWRERSDDLNVDFILDRLESELRHRKLLQGPRPEPTQFAMLLVQSFVRFPRG